MEAVFLKVINMSVTAGYVILAVLLLRLLLHRAPKKYSYLLWSVVGFRLLCPVSLTGAFSLFSLGPFDMRAAQSSGTAALEYVPSDLGLMAQPQISVGLPTANSLISSALPVAAPAASVNPMQVWIAVGTGLWLLGLTVLLLNGVVSYLRLGRRLNNAVLFRGNIWLSDQVGSPFILGFLRPRVYIPFGLDEATLEQVLAHEHCHLQRRDHLVKPLAFLLLAVHWFNPLVWLAFALVGRDMEMSCDERVLSRLEQGKKTYSATLLSFAVRQPFPAPGPLAFGETGVKSRIKNALRFRQPAKWLTVGAALVCIVALAACALNPEAEQGAEPLGPLPTAGEAIVASGAYASAACIYMVPLSSFYPFDGDSGYRYLIDVEKETFSIVQRATGNAETFTNVTWNYTAFTQDDWQSWFSLTDYLPAPDISGYDQTAYFDLSTKYRVLDMDGKLWLMQMGQDQQGGDYAWNVYSLIPESPAQTALALLLEFTNSADIYAYDHTGQDWGAPTEDFAGVVSRFEWQVDAIGIGGPANDPEYGLVLTNPDGRQLFFWNDADQVLISAGSESESILLSCGENIVDQLMPWALAAAQDPQWQWEEWMGNRREEPGLVDAPPQVLAVAEEYVAGQYARYAEEFPAAQLTGWRIENLTWNAAYALDGRELAIYQLNYEFHAAAPQHVTLAGGMYLNWDGWFMEGYPYCYYMIFDGESGEYLLTLMANDTAPGEDTFNNDLRGVRPELFQ